MAKCLLENGASAMLPDRHGNTSLHLAVLHHSVECLQVLLTMGDKMELSAKNFEGHCFYQTDIKKCIIDMYVYITPIHHVDSWYQEPAYHLSQNVIIHIVTHVTSVHWRNTQVMMDIQKLNSRKNL